MCSFMADLIVKINCQDFCKTSTKDTGSQMYTSSIEDILTICKKKLKISLVYFEKYNLYISMKNSFSKIRHYLTNPVGW